MLSWLDSILRDARLGLRTLRKHGVATMTGVASLSIALGACAAAFSLVDALILRPLPVRSPEQLIYLAFPTYAPERPESDTFSDPIFVHMRAAARDHVDLFAMSTQVMRPVVFAGARHDTERLRTQYVSGDAFAHLGVAPAAGRLIDEQDDTMAGAQAVAVLSHAYWTRRFGADPSIVGGWFTVEERQFQIVGVAEPRFTGIEPGRPTDVWFPYATYSARAFGNFEYSWFRILGRVHAKVRREEAHSILEAAFTAFRRERAQRTGSNRTPESVARFASTPLYVRTAVNGPSPLRRQYERPLWMLMSIAGLVLLIAGSNVANLFLARGAMREREMALRLSIGAGRGRLVQQMLVESALVAIAACVIGLLFAAAAAPAVVTMLTPIDDPVRLDVGLDWRLAGFASALTLLATAVFAVIPALRASDVSPITAITSGGARAGVRSRLMRPFVAVQLAFGLAVLFVGSLLVLSFNQLSGVHPGFASSNVLLLTLEADRGMNAAAQRAALLQALDRLRSIPSVEAVSSAEFNVLGRAWTHNIRVPGTAREGIEATMAPITPGYFETMKIPLLAGRAFTWADLDKQTPNAMVVNQAFVSRYYGGSPAVGRVVETRFGDADSSGAHEIIGVVGDTRYDLRKAAAPTVYIPLTTRSTGTIHVRTASDRAAIEPRLREEIRAASASLRITTVRAQSDVVNQTLLRERFLALLSGFFAIVGLSLAAVGVYAVLAHSVVQRTREIGIRAALGARPSTLVRMVLADLGVAAVVGIGCGLAAGIYLARFVEALLFEVTPVGLVSIALPLATLLLAASMAAVLPALRAARVDPVVALRCE